MSNYYPNSSVEGKHVTKKEMLDRKYEELYEIFFLSNTYESLEVISYNGNDIAKGEFMHSNGVRMNILIDISSYRKKEMFRAAYYQGEKLNEKEEDRIIGSFFFICEKSNKKRSTKRNKKRGIRSNEQVLVKSQIIANRDETLSKVGHLTNNLCVISITP
ncbi:hypothetical protein [Peribacillus asahii]|uniref:hypothetical protein n=1 Tax=Peribacillus asahii TaxID=228899 RepID=UPI00207A5B5C|nr:hypothetical protein [Peribacillus asahii]USK86179.1 hypothetical protein LIT35_05925 [Peribacillus asahii]